MVKVTTAITAAAQPNSTLDEHAPCRLYLITPPIFALATFRRDFEAALDAGDVACVQLRLKDDNGHPPSAAIWQEAIATLKPIAQERGIAFILNDLPTLAAEAGCDGVHIGQTDAALTDARQAVGQNAIIGVTCHDSRHLAMIAGEAGADYVAFGAFYPTRTKTPPTLASPSILRWWQEMMVVPCVAIGGITVDTARPLVDAGADFLAVSSGVWAHPQGPAAAVRGFNQLFAEATHR